MTDNDIIITQTLDAPREQVWKAWTEPERLKLWGAPTSYTAPVYRNNLRVGGKYHSCMRSPEGKDFWSTGVYKEIKEPEKLVMTDSFADEKGNPVQPSFYGMPGEWPEEVLITVTLEESEPGKTTMTLRHSGIPAGDMRTQTKVGWQELFDKLAESLK